MPINSQAKGKRAEREIIGLVKDVEQNIIHLLRLYIVAIIGQEVLGQ